MNLVVGQNILVDKIDDVEINFAWRSLKSDLNLSIHTFAFSQGKIIMASKVDEQNISLPDAVSQDDSGRNFEISFAQLSAKVDRIAFYGFLPDKSHYALTQMSSFQVRINDRKIGRIASMDLAPFKEVDKGALFFEFYKHNNVWKIAFKPQAYKTNKIQSLEKLGLAIEKPSIVNTHSTHTASASVINESSESAGLESSNVESAHQKNTNQENTHLENVDLKKGQNLSLSEHFPYCSAITCSLSVVPKIDDLEINVIAINRANKVNNIKDFLYRENPRLRGDGVVLDTREVLINLDQLPEDVTKIQLLVTRPSKGKRISSADFIELSLHNTYTEQKIAKYISETTDKNYNTMVLLNFYRNDKGWSIRAVGQGFSQGLQKIGERYHFTPPKLRRIATEPTPQLNNTVLNNTRPVSVEKHKKMLSLSYWLMAIAAILVLLTFSRVLFLPLAIILACAGWYFFQRASKAIKAVEHDRLEILVLNMIKAKHYQLTAFDIASNCQVNIERATEMLDALCDKGLGRTAVNREGAIYYDFSSLKNTHG